MLVRAHQGGLRLLLLFLLCVYRVDCEENLRNVYQLVKHGEDKTIKHGRRVVSGRCSTPLEVLRTMSRQTWQYNGQKIKLVSFLSRQAVTGAGYALTTAALGAVTAAALPAGRMAKYSAACFADIKLR